MLFNNLVCRQFREKLLPIHLKETIMNTLDLFVEKDRKNGHQEKTQNAVRNLIRQSLLTDDQIASALEVTVNYVADIRKQLDVPQ